MKNLRKGDGSGYDFMEMGGVGVARRENTVLYYTVLYYGNNSCWDVNVTN